MPEEYDAAQAWLEAIVGPVQDIKAFRDDPDAAQALLEAIVGPAARKKMEFDKRTGRTPIDPEYERQLLRPPSRFAGAMKSLDFMEKAQNLIDERIEPLIGNLPEKRRFELFYRSYMGSQQGSVQAPELVQPAKEQLRSEAIIEKFNRQAAGGGSAMGRRTSPTDPDLMMAYEAAMQTGHYPLKSVQKLSNRNLNDLLGYLEENK